MIIEGIFAAGLIYSSIRRNSEGLQEIYSPDQPAVCFQISSGTTLEAEIMMDLCEISGVRSVNITGQDPAYNVHVVIDSLDFSIFEKVVKKELSLVDEYPNLNFHFNIEPWIDEGASESLHAA